MLELPGGHVNPHDFGDPLGTQPPAALSCPAADFQAPPPHQIRRVPQQLRFPFSEPFGTPHELGIAEETAVLRLVFVGGALPPQPAGPGTLLRAEGAACNPV